MFGIINKIKLELLDSYIVYLHFVW